MSQISANRAQKPRAKREDSINRAFFRPGCAIAIIGLLITLGGSIYAMATGSWGMAIAGGLLSLAGIALELCAIYLLYGPTAFDPVEGEKPLETKTDRKVMRYEYHPGVVLMWLGVISSGAGLAGAILSERFLWPVIFIIGGVVLLLTGALLEVDVIVYRIGLRNTGKRLPEESEQFPR